eukprot:gi/632945989/ref/XP_007888334.1/ PREDICTED: probable inactive tRNA-specific adenosine deaminase-like protein 3 [Callorhinchus milii]
MEPHCKRRRTEEMDPFPWEMIPVLSDEKSGDVELVEAYAAPIFNKKETSRLVKLMANIYPLNDLPHIKRVRACVDKDSDHPLEILICLRSSASVADVPDRKPSLIDLLPSGMGDCNSLGQPFQVTIPAKQPLTRPQFEAASQHWPTAFHENKQVTEALRGQLFNPEEKAKMQMFMGKAIEAARAGKEMGMEPVGAVIVDPATNQIIAVGHDCRNGPNALLHAVMVCIDLVAHGQGGGAFDHNKYPNCLFVATKDLSEDNNVIDIGKPLIPSDHQNAPGSGKDLPYICTGYDLYVSREPCVMCAMALVHSRIHRVFYATSSPDGALGTKYKIHTKKDLNHHYEVFKGLMEKECQRLLA